MNRVTVVLACFLIQFLIAPLSAGDVTILRDEFDTLPSGPLSKVLWARAEYHFLPESGPKVSESIARGWQQPEARQEACK